MPAQFTLPGVDMLQRQLAALPRILTEDGRRIVQNTAAAAAARITGRYQTAAKTGTLARRVSVRALGAGQGKVMQDVASRAPHGWLYEHGSRLRRTKRNLPRGAMPAADVFVPTIIMYRAVMYREIRAMLERNGLKVSGDA